MIPAALLAGICALAAVVYRRWFTPSCPRCHGRDWDRKLCAPLLFCRRCATRVDRDLRVCN